ncbi:MAG: hypothetical protein MZV65_52065 [Chromatiales bacterium]|nr:hypothetical protein [Chromatiales bacterium]
MHDRIPLRTVRQPAWHSKSVCRWRWRPLVDPDEPRRQQSANEDTLRVDPLDRRAPSRRRAAATRTPRHRPASSLRTESQHRPGARAGAARCWRTRPVAAAGRAGAAGGAPARMAVAGVRAPSGSGASSSCMRRLRYPRPLVLPATDRAESPNGWAARACSANSGEPVAGPDRAAACSATTAAKVAATRRAGASPDT